MSITGLTPVQQPFNTSVEHLKPVQHKCLIFKCPSPNHVSDHLKEEAELLKERLILEEMLDVVEQRDALVSLLEQQKLQERQEDQDLEAVMMSRGLGLYCA